MAAAIVELDALADTVRATAENDDLLAIRNLRFGAQLADERRLVGRIHVSSWRSEFGSAGVDALENGAHVQTVAQLCHFLRALLGQAGKAGVGEAHGLQRTQVFGILRQAVLAHTRFHVHDGLELGDEPWVDLAVFVYFGFGHAHAQCLCDHAQTVWRRCANGGANGVLGAFALFVTGDFDLIETRQAGFEATQSLLERLSKCTANRHDFTDRLHGGGQDWRCAREFLEGKTWDFGDDVVDGWFEGRRRRAAGDVVVQLVQRVADCKLCRDLGNREAGGLGGECRRARNTRVHFDDDEAAILRVDGELHVRAARFHADFAQNRNRCIAHHLVFFVRQRQGRGNGDRVAGVNAHRVDVFDGADDDAVVGLVADDFHFIFLPAENRFFDQHFGGWGCIETAADDFEELRTVIGNAAARATHCEGWADNCGQADDIDSLRGNGHGVADVALLAVRLAQVPLVFEVV